MKTKKVTKASPKTSSISKASEKHAPVHHAPVYKPAHHAPPKPEKSKEPESMLKLSRYNESPPGGWVWPGQPEIKATTWKDLKLAVRNATGLSDEEIENFVAKSLPEDWRTPA